MVDTVYCMLYTGAHILFHTDNFFSFDERLSADSGIAVAPAERLEVAAKALQVGCLVGIADDRGLPRPVSL